MNITDSPNLKPFRDYDEHEVINLFAHEDSDVNKGTFVTITVADGNTNVIQGANSPSTPHQDYFGALSNVPSRATVMRETVTWKVASAAAGDTVLGMTLYDVKELNAYSEPFIYRPKHERIEQQVVVSGEAVPILTRGIVKLNGFSGTPGPNSGAIIHPDLDGTLLVSNADGVAPGAITGDLVGKFLSSADADDYALFKIER